MHLRIELTEADLRKLVFRHVCEKLGSVGLIETDVKIEVKSKQNWKSEWEEAAFRAVVNK